MTDINALVERLRQPLPIFVDDDHRIKTANAERLEVADALTRLQAENERLVTALRNLIENADDLEADDDADCLEVDRGLIEEARALLSDLEGK